MKNFMKLLLATFGIMSLVFAGCSTSVDKGVDVSGSEDVKNVEDVTNVEGTADEESAETVDQESTERGE